MSPSQYGLGARRPKSRRGLPRARSAPLSNILGVGRPLEHPVCRTTSSAFAQPFPLDCRYFGKSAVIGKNIWVSADQRVPSSEGEVAGGQYGGGVG